ncbi:hypothetical protein Goari_002617 [Gossypium aridum]|uniref:Uncharacterized protein n=1 Tax=Gossypium aridum TaxID=34290 RepID=A0A7J8Y9S2_GOSAI|nr:hypothetical protein [Gossypium aridum]
MKEVITFIRGFGREYCDLLVTLKHLGPREMIRWNPPPRWVKVNVDVGTSPCQNSCNCRSGRNASWNLVSLRDKCRL